MEKGGNIEKRTNQRKPQHLDNYDFGRANVSFLLISVSVPTAYVKKGAGVNGAKEEEIKMLDDQRFHYLN